MKKGFATSVILYTMLLLFLYQCSFIEIVCFVTYCNQTETDTTYYVWAKYHNTEKSTIQLKGFYVIQ